jgi:excisionase family DNA binding protein
MPQVFDRVAVESWLKDEIVQKFPRGGLGDIKLGSQLIVNPYETAVFVRGGEPMGTFEPGRHTLTTENIPMLTNLMEWGLFGGENVFTADVYFVKTTDLPMRWGTKEPVIVEHPERSPGASAMRGNGTYMVRVKDPWRFLNAMDAFRDSVNLTQLKTRLDPMVGVMMQDKLSELAQAKDLGPADLQSFSKELNDLLQGLLQEDFDALGLELEDFNIVMGLHPDSLAIVTNMGYGTSYVQKQTADALLAAAENPEGSGLAEIGIGAMGIGALQGMQPAPQQQQQTTPGAPATEVPGSASGMPDVMTPEQAAEILKVSPEDVMAAIKAGELNARKIGNAYRISKANLEKFLEG